MESFPEIDPSLQDDDLNQRWQTILGIRGDVTKALEGARQTKVVGHPLDAVVKLALPEELKEAFAGQEELLRSVFIVSKVVLSPVSSLVNPAVGLEVPGLQVQIEPAPGNKCERCWVRSEQVGRFADHPTICDRCYGVVAG
jgi:isoleucyl-tRNA synthetase